jgi:hypothetical protein
LDGRPTDAEDNNTVSAVEKHKQRQQRTWQQPKIKAQIIQYYYNQIIIMLLLQQAGALSPGCGPNTNPTRTIFFSREVHGMSSSSRTHDPPWKMMVIGIR